MLLVEGQQVVCLKWNMDEGRVWETGEQQWERSEGQCILSKGSPEIS
jgi:hypothetical protein